VNVGGPLGQCAPLDDFGDVRASLPSHARSSSSPADKSLACAHAREPPDPPSRRALGGSAIGSPTTRPRPPDREAQRRFPGPPPAWAENGGRGLPPTGGRVPSRGAHPSRRHIPRVRAREPADPLRRALGGSAIGSRPSRLRRPHRQGPAPVSGSSARPAENRGRGFPPPGVGSHRGARGGRPPRRQGPRVRARAGAPDPPSRRALAGLAIGSPASRSHRPDRQPQRRFPGPSERPAENEARGSSPHGG
jgi:hypothetical protein